MTIHDRTHTILVVEDEEESRQALMQILELEGFSTVGASNGAEAMDYLHTSSRPCLIVLDLNMPVMNGRQLRAALRQVEELATIPVVVVSARRVLQPGILEQLGLSGNLWTLMLS
ncbi:MAG: response regulator [Candidatus Binataceae bacterium]